MSLRGKILIVVSGIGILTCVIFAIIIRSALYTMTMAEVDAVAKNLLDRSVQMFMVSTVKFHNEYNAATSDEVKAKVKADWDRSILAVDEAVIHDFGDGENRVRLIGDEKIFGIKPLGGDNTVIKEEFETRAAKALADGKTPMIKENDGKTLRISVPLPSLAHAGCAECHLGNATQNIVLGTLNAYVPLEHRFAAMNGRIIEFTLSLVAVLAVMIIVITWYLGRAVIKPVQKLQKLAHIMREGDLSERATVSTQDEMGKMAQAMNELVDSLGERAKLAEAIANGNLTNKVTLASDRDVLGKALLDMTGQLNRVLGRVSEAVSEVSQSAEQLSSASESLSQGATEQAASLEEIGSSMTEIGSQTQTNAGNAQQANRLAIATRESAEHGATQMNQLMTSIHGISTSSREVSKVIKVIDDIAFQTNLLALNAAVEAARAGRHGKGFAVVADEVRNLAARSAKAAKETSEMIEGSIRQVTEGTDVAGKTSAALTEIVGAAVKVADLLGDIAAASSEQAQGISQVSQGLTQINAVTQRSTASAEETASAAEELRGQAGVLREVVSKFKLDESLADDHVDVNARPALGNPSRYLPRY
jgi:methyl-accepting chemotaxis protein